MDKLKFVTNETIFETSLTTVAGMAAGFFVSFPGLENFFIVMMMLISFAFLTSVFLLPSALTAHHKSVAAILGRENWADIEGGPTLETSGAIDVELISNG